MKTKLHHWLSAILLTLTAGQGQAATIQLVIPNAGFEEQGNVLDGDGDSIPLAQDPADFAANRVPGWFPTGDDADVGPSVGIFNPMGSGAQGFTTTTAHSGNLVLRVADEDGAYAPIRTTDGAAFLLGIGDVITVTGWIVQGSGIDADIRFELYRLDALPGLSNIIHREDSHVRGVKGPEWVPFSLTFSVDEANAPYAGAPLGFGFDSESGMLLDDLSISVERIPEPGSVALAATGLLWLNVRRRRAAPAGCDRQRLWTPVQVAGTQASRLCWPAVIMTAESNGLPMNSVGGRNAAVRMWIIPVTLFHRRRCNNKDDHAR